MRSLLSFFWETAKVIIVALVIVIPIRYFLFQPFIVGGQSMEPNLSHGDYLIVDEISYRFREPSRGEIIVFRYPENPSFRHIKRIIGLPGETIEVKDGNIVIINADGIDIILNESEYYPYRGDTDGTTITLDDGEYFVMGDNRPVSFDSRRWGALPRENIIGRFFIRVLPLGNFGKAEVPSY